MDLTYTDANGNFVVNKLTRSIYNELKRRGELKDDELYFITDDKPAVDVVSGMMSSYYTKNETSSSAQLNAAFATKTYVSSNYQPKGNYLTAHQSLSNYYTKSNVYNQNEIDDILLGYINRFDYTDDLVWGESPVEALVKVDFRFVATGITGHLYMYPDKNRYRNYTNSWYSKFNRPDFNANIEFTMDEEGVDGCLRLILNSFPGSGLVFDNVDIFLGENIFKSDILNDDVTVLYTSPAYGTIVFTINAVLDDANSYYTAYSYAKDVVDKHIETAISGSTNTFVDGHKENLSVQHISREDYAQLLKNSATLSNTLYIVSSDSRSNYGKTLQDVADPENDTDAANKQYVDSEIAKIDVSGQLTGYAKTSALTAYQPRGNYLTAHQSLTGYYTKSETNNLSTTFRNGLVATTTLTSSYYTKTQVNSISSAISGSTDTFIDGSKKNLSVMHIAESAYRDLVKAGTALSNVMYITSSDVEDMYGERVVNVGYPIADADAATKAYVDTKIGDIDTLLKEIIG